MADSIAYCSSCGRKRDAEHRYCPSCGSPLVPEPGGTTTPADSAAVGFPWGRSVSDSFVLLAGSYHPLSFPPLDAGTTIELHFSVAGGHNDIGFGIQGPAGHYVSDAGRVYGSQNVSYVVERPGTYRLIFDNSFSIFTSKAVTLNYRVSR